jgi:histidyl-tRNA synthetase
MAQSLQTVKGMHDLLVEDSPQWELFEDTVRDVARQYGYRNMRTPIVEPTALFSRSIGEATDIVEKEMFSFADGDDHLTLRPEATAGIVRSVVEHGFLRHSPLRVWTMGPMFRHEQPQKGRYRQFHQFDCEALGYGGPDVDAELIVMLARIWKRLGLTGDTYGARLEINTIGDAAERRAHREKLIAYFESHAGLLDDDAKRRLHTNPLRILDTKNRNMQEMVNGAPKLIELLGEESLKHFEGLKRLLDEAGLTYKINPRLVRGMDYYNRTVFEWVTDALGNTLTITGGGRYDGLIEQMGGKATPAIGFGMGVERVVLCMEAARGATHAPTQPLDAYVIHAGEGAQAQANRVAEGLRDAGRSVVVHAGGGGFKSQMKKADASGAKLALIIGEDEVNKGEVAIKPLRTNHEQQGEQQSVAAASLATAVAAAL